MNFKEEITAIEPHGSSVTVRTGSGPKEFDAVVITAGQWTKTLLDDLLPQLTSRLTLTRQVLAWFTPLQPDQFDARSRFPVFAIEAEKDNIFYGFPSVGTNGVKIASHKLGRAFSTPGAIDRKVTREDTDEIIHFAEIYLPGVAGDIRDTAVCTYTNSDDGDFFVGLLPSHENVVIASPCSGHGFKFASILGPILAELATKGTTEHQALINPFKFDRARKTKVA